MRNARIEKKNNCHLTLFDQTLLFPFYRELEFHKQFSDIREHKMKLNERIIQKCINQ